MDQRTIIGLVGQPSSGKDTVAAYLVAEHGFTHVSTSNFIRAYIAEQGLGEPTRDLMRSTGIFLRTQHGADYLTRLALENGAPKLIISGMRTVAEAETATKARGVIVSCTTPMDIRYRRAVERGRIGDGVSFEMFKQQEEAELSNSTPEAQNMSAVIALADYTLDNSGTLEELHQKIEDVLAHLGMAV